MDSRGQTERETEMGWKELEPKLEEEMPICESEGRGRTGQRARNPRTTTRQIDEQRELPASSRW